MAICYPLLYNVTMSRVYYLLLAVGCKLGGLVNMVSVITSITLLPFCQWHVLSHFYDFPPPLALACSDPPGHPDLDYWLQETHPSYSIVVILVFCMSVIMTILRILSASNKQKAFSTCTSHLTAIDLNYEITMYTYLQPSWYVSWARNQIVSVFYTMVIPMLNPLIYSLRGKKWKLFNGRY